MDVTQARSIVNGRSSAPGFSMVGYGMGWFRQTYLGNEVSPCEILVESSTEMQTLHGSSSTTPAPLPVSGRRWSCCPGNVRGWW